MTDNFTYMNRTLTSAQDYPQPPLPTPDPQYRAAWITSTGATVHGDLTSESDATAQVAFLKRSRTAWLEDSLGTRIESTDYPSSLFASDDPADDGFGHCVTDADNGM
jgi:hypothetical protein